MHVFTAIKTDNKQQLKIHKKEKLHKIFLTA